MIIINNLESSLARQNLPIAQLGPIKASKKCSTTIKKLLQNPRFMLLFVLIMLIFGIIFGFLWIKIKKQNNDLIKQNNKFIEQNKNLMEQFTNITNQKDAKYSGSPVAQENNECIYDNNNSEPRWNNNIIDSDLKNNCSILNTNDDNSRNNYDLNSTYFDYPKNANNKFALEQNQQLVPVSKKLPTWWIYQQTIQDDDDKVTEAILPKSNRMESVQQFKFTFYNIAFRLELQNILVQMIIQKENEEYEIEQQVKKAIEPYEQDIKSYPMSEKKHSEKKLNLWDKLKIFFNSDKKKVNTLSINRRLKFGDKKIIFSTINAKKNSHYNIPNKLPKK